MFSIAAKYQRLNMTNTSEISKRNQHKLTQQSLDDNIHPVLENMPTFTKMYKIVEQKKVRVKHLQ